MLITEYASTASDVQTARNPSAEESIGLFYRGSNSPDCDGLDTCNQIEAIVKLTERCNINCTYCYFFNKDDLGYERHPKYLKIEHAREMARYLREGAKLLYARGIKLDMHGGEPLMLGVKRFEEICDMFTQELKDFELSFRIQTNGMLINDEWIRLFKKYNMHVGVSIDGDEHTNDRYRIDHKGRGTYQRVKAGVKRLQAAVKSGYLRPVGALCVINPEVSGARIYRHLVHELGFTGFNFLLPLDDFDELSQDKSKTNGYGKFLCDAFDAYIEDDNPDVYVRTFETAIRALVGGENYSLTRELVDGYSNQAIVLSSDGEVGPDDTLRPSSGGFFTGEYTIYNSSLRDFVNSEDAKQIRHATQELCEKCQECVWRNACRGGALINRYSKHNGFNNPSALCDELFMYYEHIARYLVRSGVPESKIASSLEWRP